MLKNKKRSSEFPVLILTSQPVAMPVGVVGDPALRADLAGLRVEAGDDGVAAPLPRDGPRRAAARSQFPLIE